MLLTKLNNISIIIHLKKNHNLISPSFVPILKEFLFPQKPVKQQHQVSDCPRKTIRNVCN